MEPPRRAAVISTPRQQVSAVVATRDFLYRLTQPSLTRRVPLAVRGEARALLRHYPLPETLRPVLEEAFGAGPEIGARQSARQGLEI